VNFLAHAWSIFKDKVMQNKRVEGPSSSEKLHKTKYFFLNDRTITASIINRIGIDAAALPIRHIKVNDQEQYVRDMPTNLNKCFTRKANIDQIGRAFIQDAVMSLCDEGVIAIIPTDTVLNPNQTAGYDILSLRIGQILEWFPKHVKVRVYNEETGYREDIIIGKDIAAIIENPLYSVMNEPNSTLKRLSRKISLLDQYDENTVSGKLDILIQLPYVIRTEARRAEAERRKADIEKQLEGSKYGIAYTDGTERIIQLNRAAENNLLSQIEYLTRMLFGQLGITENIFNGTATEEELLNYYNRTIEPILSSITEGMENTFLSKTALTQGQRIVFFREPFKLLPLKNIAEVVDTFTRNEVLSSNEIRSIMGFKPVDTPQANALRNANIANRDEELGLVGQNGTEEEDGDGEDEMTEEDFLELLRELDDSDSQLDNLDKELNHMDDDDFLLHYASKYYDPVKAHEYYMRTRKLKGHKRKTLNEQGKAALAYVRSNMKSEYSKNKLRLRTTYITNRNKKKEAYKNSMLNYKNSTKAKLKSQSEMTKSKIQSLMKSLKGMTKEERKLKRAGIKEQIAKLREDNKKARSEINTVYKNWMVNYKGIKKRVMDDDRTEYGKQRTNLKSDYRKNLESEIEKIYGEAKFHKPSGKRGRPRKNTGGSSIKKGRKGKKGRKEKNFNPNITGKTKEGVKLLP